MYKEIVVEEVKPNTPVDKSVKVESIKDSKVKTAISQVEKSEYLIIGFMDYIQSKRFFDKCDEIAKEKGVTSKKVANNFFEKILGSIGDILGITINITQSLTVTIINILSWILKGTAGIICKVARMLVNTVTLKRTVLG